ncbi:MAG: mercury(II) reductase [Thermocrispum sp.]
MRYDLAIIGSGSAAFAAAITARGNGASVVMIERGTVGGTCVNTGCVPSKALLAAAEARQVGLDGRFPGIAASAFGVDLPRLLDGKRDLVESMRAEKYTDLAADYGWDIVSGTARLAPGTTLDVELADGGHTTVDAAHYLIATGSAPTTPPIDGLAVAGYLTSTTAMELPSLPASMIVLGGNAVGLEQAQLWSRLGAKVTVIEQQDRLAPSEEPELSAAIRDVFSREGIGVVTGATTTHVDRDTAGYHLTLTGSNGAPSGLRAEQLLVATGRAPLTYGLNLDAVGVKTGPRGEVVVDDTLRSDNPRIWAAGDVTGHPQFVYVAAAHGTLVADNALGDAARAIDHRHLPRVTFTSPALASVGLTDAKAAEQGIACHCRVLPLQRVPRALVNRDTHGVIKLVAERGTGRLLGAHVAADSAGELIAAAGYALAAGMTVHQLATQWSPYLTMAEGLKLTAQAFTRDITTLSCCAA